MEKDFDIKFKQENYQIPEGFFETITEKTLFEVKRRKSISLRRRFVAVCSAAVVLLGVFIVGIQSQRSEDITPESLVAMFSETELQGVLLALDCDTFYSEDIGNE